MGWITGVAIFFVIWWTVLFAVLPFGMRSQADDGNVMPGTPASAPASFSLARKAMWTTVASLVVFAGFYVLTEVYDIGADSFPHLIPGT